MQYVMFMDEAGDHNLRNIDSSYPAFCLAGCIFESVYYHAIARPRVDALKMRFWGRTDVILHSRYIRKQQGPFVFLGDREKREEFYTAINDLVSELEFTILAVVILKAAHLNEHGSAARHPYHLALESILERYAAFMRTHDDINSGYVLAESRGKQPDQLLKTEYRRLRDLESDRRPDLSNITGLWMEKKSANLVGLQIADLVAYPIAAKVLHPDAEQKAFDVLREKIATGFAHDRQSFLGSGLKILPRSTLEPDLLWGNKTEHGS